MWMSEVEYVKILFLVIDGVFKLQQMRKVSEMYYTAVFNPTISSSQTFRGIFEDKQRRNEGFLMKFALSEHLYLLKNMLHLWMIKTIKPIVFIKF